MGTITPGSRIKAQRKAAWSGSWATLRDLEVFLAMIEGRTATAAARRLDISQPAVSRTLIALEEKSGHVLFKRQGTGLAPTADALALYEQIQPIFHSLDQLKGFEWTQTKPVNLRIACPPTVAQCFLESITALFLRDNPNTLVSMDIVTTPEVLELVADQRADIGIADVSVGNTGLTRSPLRRSRMVCVLPEGHPLCAKQKIEVRDLHQQPMVMLAKRNPVRPVLDRLFSQAASQPRVVVETATALSAVNYVSQGVGITLVNPFPVLLARFSGVTVRAFTAEVAYETSFFTSSAAKPNAVAQRYMESVREHQPQATPHCAPIQ